MDKFNKVVYVSHPYGGKKENADKVASIILDLMKKYPNVLFISPVHAFIFMYDKIDYDTGLDYCLSTIDICDEVWVFGDYNSSTGCKREIEYCKANCIPCIIHGKGVRFEKSRKKETDDD